jgi:histone deacetylase 6
MKSVRAVVQVVGHSKVPMVPKYSDDLRTWYHKVGFDFIWDFGSNLIVP